MSEKMKEMGFTVVNCEQMGKLKFNPFKEIGEGWMLVTAGNSAGWNTMTASWGFVGVMWGKNTCTAVLRPQRYTKEFLEKEDYYTLSFFEEDMRKALSYCGSHSGRDVDKVKQTGLSPIFIEDKAEDSEGANFSVTSFEQAKMVIVCKKVYVQPMEPEFFVCKENDEKWYPQKDYHIQYIGEIVKTYTKNSK